MQEKLKCHSHSHTSAVDMTNSPGSYPLYGASVIQAVLILLCLYFNMRLDERLTVLEEENLPTEGVVKQYSMFIIFRKRKRRIGNTSDYQ